MSLTGPAAMNHHTVGEGTPLLLVHGFTVDHRLLTPLDEVFTSASPWQRIYVDLPGFGRSPRVPYPASADAIADCLLRFVDREIGDRRFAVLGNSFGGQLARHLVAERPDQVLGLGLLCPMVVPHGRRSLPAQTVVEREPGLLARLTPEEAAEFTAVAVRQTSAGWDRFRQHALPGIVAHDREAAAELLERYTLAVTPETRFPTFDGPSVLITARQDHVVGWQDSLGLLASYPRMASAIVEGAGHNAHLERPAVINALVADWLDRVTASLAG